MKNYFLISILLLSTLLYTSCNFEKKTEKAKTKTSQKVNESDILVYYFHSSIRCETCVAVDENTLAYLKELFPTKMKNGEIIFQSINIDNEGEDLIEKYQIYGQTMLFVKGDKVINETDNAFMWVITKPVKWKGIVKNRVLELMQLVMKSKAPRNHDVINYL